MCFLQIIGILTGRKIEMESVTRMHNRVLILFVLFDMDAPFSSSGQRYNIFRIKVRRGRGTLIIDSKEYPLCCSEEGNSQEEMREESSSNDKQMLDMWMRECEELKVHLVGKMADAQWTENLFVSANDRQYIKNMPDSVKSE